VHSFDVYLTTYEFVLKIKPACTNLNGQWDGEASFLTLFQQLKLVKQCENCMAILKLTLSLFLSKFVPLINEYYYKYVLQKKET